MTKPYRLTPAQWESIERYAEDNSYDACFLELRARIEALEAAQQPPLFTAEEVARIVAPITRDRALVETVARLIANFASTARPGDDATPTAQAAILEVAAWLRSEYPRREGYGTAWANLIEQEANQ